MDCFYAAIEVRDRPSLRGKPVGVGGARDRRGVLTTCNYEARKFGVRSAMPTFMALQRCPKLIVLPTRFDVYRREAARDSRDPASLHTAGRTALARRSVSRCHRASRRARAARAGDPRTDFPEDKTDRLRRDRAEQADGEDRQRAEQTERPMRSHSRNRCRNSWQALPVRKTLGHRRGDRARNWSSWASRPAASCSVSRGRSCIENFGKFGIELYDLCRGIDERPVEPDRERKSLSTEETFTSDLTTLEECEEKCRSYSKNSRPSWRRKSRPGE